MAYAYMYVKVCQVSSKVPVCLELGMAVGICVRAL